MGLFDMFKKKAEPAAAAAPASISASAGADVLCSPVKGKVIKMADVPDPVFGGEVLGKGCAVWPEDDLVYAPCDGKVTVTMGHAVGLQSDSGIEVLVHVGVDTVNMNGDGFEGFVKADDVVKAGAVRNLVKEPASAASLKAVRVSIPLMQESASTAGRHRSVRARASTFFSSCRRSDSAHLAAVT